MTLSKQTCDCSHLAACLPHVTRNFPRNKQVSLRTPVWQLVNEHWLWPRMWHYQPPTSVHGGREMRTLDFCGPRHQPVHTVRGGRSGWTRPCSRVRAEALTLAMLVKLRPEPAMSPTMTTGGRGHTTFQLPWGQKSNSGEFKNNCFSAL